MFVNFVQNLKQEEVKTFLILWTIFINLLAVVFTKFALNSANKTGLLVIAALLGFPGIWVGTNCLNKIKSTSKSDVYDDFRRRLWMITSCWLSLFLLVGIYWGANHQHQIQESVMSEIQKSPMLRKFYARIMTSSE